MFFDDRSSDRLYGCKQVQKKFIVFDCQKRSDVSFWYDNDVNGPIWPSVVISKYAVGFEHFFDFGAAA